nr:phosphate signaling complex protein PhoU [uncultured Eisenbergiella sp.]
MTMRTIYLEELNGLRKSLAEMGEAVEVSFDMLLTAVDSKDEELKMQIIRGDRMINDMERSIESKCLSLITRQQPIAGDLRMISAALKVVTDIERIGDQTADIAELMLRLKDCDLDTYSRHITGMLQVAKEIVHDAVHAFVTRDSKAADEVIRHDDVVDSLFAKVKDDLVFMLQEGVDNIDACVDVLMIAKYLERIGDHAVNIAEWEIFQESGAIQDIRLM